MAQLVEHETFFFGGGEGQRGREREREGGRILRRLHAQHKAMRFHLMTMSEIMT